MLFWGAKKKSSFGSAIGCNPLAPLNLGKWFWKFGVPVYLCC